MHGQKSLVPGGGDAMVGTRETGEGNISRRGGTWEDAGRTG